MKRKVSQVWSNVIRSTNVSEPILVQRRTWVCSHWTCSHRSKLSWRMSPLIRKIHFMVIVQSSMTILTTDLANWRLTLLKIRLGLRLWRGKLTLTIVGLDKELGLTSRKLSRLTIAVTSSITMTMNVATPSSSSIEILIELINCHSKWRRILKIFNV